MTIPQAWPTCWLNCPPAGATLSEEYVTEYSTDRIEMHVGAVQAGQRVVLVDDLIATGGTLREYGSGLVALAPCVALGISINQPSSSSWHACDHFRLGVLLSQPVHVCVHAGAGLDLVKKAGGDVVEAAAVIDLGLGGRQKLPEDLPLFVIVEKQLDE